MLLSLSLACVKRRISVNDTTLPNSQSFNPAFELVDPASVKVEVEAAALSTEAFQETYRLPTFQMQFNDNDFVKILRCQESYREYLEYTLSQVAGKTVDSRKWIWLDSFGDIKRCKVASNRFNSPIFQDIGAKNGKFFYIINPCVSAGISAIGREECSYHLAVTNTLDYQESPSTHVLHQSMELADAESAYDAIISQLLGLSRAIVNEQERCEAAIKKIQTQKNAQSFAWDLLSTAIAVGGAFGARALISKKIISKAANYVGKYNQLKKTKGFLQSVGTASNFNKNLFTAGFFAGALGVSTLVRSLKSKNAPAATHPSCQKAEELSQEIIKIQDDKLLEQAMNEIIRISAEISQFDAKFNAYGTTSFNMPAVP